MRTLLVCWMALVAAAAGAQDPIRTADITVRGLKPSDFPRVTKLADNVYAYEQIDPTKRTVTVNNLIVITTGGVAALGKAEQMDVSYFVPAHGFIDSAAVMREEERNYRMEHCEGGLTGRET